MGPCLLKRGLESNHRVKKNRNENYFWWLDENEKKHHLDKTSQNFQNMAGIVETSKKVILFVKATHEGSYCCRVGCSTSSKTIVWRLSGEKDVAKLDSVSLFNVSAKCRIRENLPTLSIKITAGMRTSKFGFAIQVKESTGVTNCFQLHVYVDTYGTTM